MSLYDAPISRSWIDAALPWLRGLFGAGFVAYSAISTIIFLGADLFWLFAFARKYTIATGYADGYWVAAMVALILFVGEIVTAERYPRTYRAFLWPDAFYSARGVHAGLAGAIAVMLMPYVSGPTWIEGMSVAALIGWIVAWPPALWFGYKVAKWGEVLLFGQRRGDLDDQAAADEPRRTLPARRRRRIRG